LGKKGREKVKAAGHRPKRGKSAQGRAKFEIKTKGVGDRLSGAGSLFKTRKDKKRIEIHAQRFWEPSFKKKKKRNNLNSKGLRKKGKKKKKSAMLGPTGAKGQTQTIGNRAGEEGWGAKAPYRHSKKKKPKTNIVKRSNKARLP